MGNRKVAFEVSRNHRTFLRDELPAEQVESAIEWLKEHNGHAPPTVQLLIRYLDRAVKEST